MRRVRWTMRWGIVTLSVASAFLFLGGALLSNGLVVSSGPAETSGSSTSPVRATVTPAAIFTPAGIPIYTPSSPLGKFCASTFGYYGEVIFGPGCSIGTINIGPINSANAGVAAQNTVTLNANLLNITNSEVANLNATMQELVSYYENRAEAIVPFFLNATAWNASVAAQVVIDSGLVSSLEGIETAFAAQQYSDWNATANTWNAAFASGGSFSNDYALEECLLPPFTGCNNLALSAFYVNDTPIAVTRPFEDWALTPIGGVSVNNTFFNLQGGGTVVNANQFNSSAFGTSFADYTIYDFTQGFSFQVPRVNYTNWIAGNLPIVSTIHHINQFDLLKLSCTQTCSTNLAFMTVQTSNAYALSPHTSFRDAYNSMFPQLTIYNTGPTSNNPIPRWSVPTFDEGLCVTSGQAPATTGPCATYLSPNGGNSTAISSGPGQAVAGRYTLLGFPETAENLINNTLTMAYDYWLTLRAITNNGTYSIPANCAIPTPSDAFPTSTNFQNYNLSANNVEAVYLSYLNAVAREYGQVFTNSVGFCQNPNLGFAFNWSGAWQLKLNITASVFINGTNNNTRHALFLNGTPDPSASYSDAATWPVYNIDPALLYPYEYQMNVPLNTIYPVPINDPLIGVLVNYPQNLYFGNAAFHPAWGVPTYVSLTGAGNYVGVSGNLTSITSGNLNSSGDAILITSCVLKGVPQNPCDLSVTYFDNFTFGLVHAIIPPNSANLFPPIGGLGNSCGFQVLNQFYDGWAGYFGSLVANAFAGAANAVSGVPIIGGGLSYLISGIGCILAWIVVILLFSIFVYVAVRVGLAIYGGARGVRRSYKENVS